MRGVGGAGFLLSAMLMACGSDKASGPASSTNAMTATVSGAAWTASASRSATYANQVLTITGIDNANLLVTIAVANVAGTGTFSLAPGNTHGALGNVINGARIWASSLQGGSGTITVTTLTATRVAGTFLFTGVPATASATGSVVVTGGAFDLPR
jgi:Family of unknown function (DUF6252)